MERKENMEYPFGFGFELMNNPQAMERFFAMSEDEQKEWMKQIREIESKDEVRRLLDELTASERKQPKRGRKKSGSPHLPRH